MTHSVDGLPRQSFSRRVLKRAFFPELPPLNLALCRLILGTWVIYYFNEHGPSFLAACIRSPHELFRPVGIVTFLDGPLSEPTFMAIYSGFWVVTLCFTCGFLHRYLAPVFGILLLFLWTYRNSWGFIYHTENSLVFSGLLLAFAPSADTLSVDAWLTAQFPRLRAWLASKAHEPAMATPLQHALRRGSRDFRYGWPIQLAILVATIAYSVAGWAKIGAQGLAWADGAVLEGQILRNAYWYEMLQGQAPENTVLVLQWPSWTFTGLATMTLIVEIFGPLVVFDRRVAFLYALVMFSFHWGVQLTMGIPFIYHLYGAAFAAFIPWEMLRLRRRSFSQSESAFSSL